MKTIKTMRDLAINGAPPAFDSALHVGRPNVGNKAAYLSYIGEILDRRWLTNNGPLVVELERLVAEHHGVKQCIAMSNGTVALEIAVRALGLAGEVIVPSYTFIATAHSLYWQGITPVFADIDPHTHMLDPKAVRQKITSKTTGILGVHLWGRTSAAEELQLLANEYGLELLFDAAHAFGCSHKGKMIGNLGRCEILSFHATKFFNTMEGGAVLTNDEALASTIRLMRNFGFSATDKVTHIGTNAKMMEAAAAMGIVNLASLGDIVAANLQCYENYISALSSIPGISLLHYSAKERNNYQYVVIEVSSESVATRDEILDALRAENILARKYFWPGCHNMEPYKTLFPTLHASLPHTNAIAEKVIVLPTGPSIDATTICTIASVITLLANGHTA